MGRQVFLPVGALGDRDLAGIIVNKPSVFDLLKANDLRSKRG